MQIHVFNVGQAMSQLIVFPSGYRVLVDAGELGWNTGANARYVAGRLRAILGEEHPTVDAAVLTHLHQDHVGEVPHGGLYALIETHGIRFRKILDRSSGRWLDRDGDGACNASEIVWDNVGQVSSTAVKWVCYATNPANTKVYSVRETAKLCSQTQIAPPDAGASVTVVTTDALGAQESDGTPVAGDHSGERHAPSENDYSVGLLVRYRRFAYGTFGDLDGQYSASAFDYTYHDIESTAAKRVGEVDVYHVNHHGSAHSSNAGWVRALSPAVSLISCGTNNSYGHPDQASLDRVLAAGDVYLTNRGNPAARYGPAVVAGADIVLTVDGDDGAAYVVDAGATSRKYASKNVKSPACSL
eukprot:m51a1_g12062 hypothetical protein (357) ;mRNA; f:2008-3384